MRRAVTAAFLCSVAAPAVGDDARRNPFAHTVDDTPELAAPAGQLDEEELQVTAILVAGEKSLVNVNGSLIGVGEQQFGYRLLRVGEESATFVRDGETVIVSLFDRQEERQRD